jgi:hypothetical protein
MRKAIRARTSGFGTAARYRPTLAHRGGEVNDGPDKLQTKILNEPTLATALTLDDERARSLESGVCADVFTTGEKNSAALGPRRHVIPWFAAGLSLTAGTRPCYTRACLAVSTTQFDAMH